MLTFYLTFEGSSSMKDFSTTATFLVLILLGFASWTRAQSLSPISASFPTHSTNASVVLSVTATVPENIDIMWGFQWKINRQVAALISVDEDFSTEILVSNSEHEEKIMIRVSPDVVNEDDYILTSELTIESITTATNLNVSIFSGDFEDRPWISLTVTNCSVQEEDLLIVETTSSNDEDGGYFTCTNGGVLHHLNGTLVLPRKISCETVKELFVKNVVQCWNAPEVTNLEISPSSVKEGDSLSLTCVYEEVLPIGSATTFYVGDEAFTVPKSEAYTIESVTRDFNNQPVSCQAVTPFTEAYPERGASTVTRVNVLYLPFQDLPVSCTWIYNTTGTCNVTFKSNPIADFVSLTKDGEAVKGDESTSFSMSLETDEQGSLTLQTLHLKQLQVSGEDGGNYVLTVQSSISPPSNHTFEFQVTLLGLQVASINRDGLIIGVTIAGVLLLIILLTIIIICCKKNQTTNSSKTDNEKKNGNKKESDVFLQMEDRGGTAPAQPPAENA